MASKIATTRLRKEFIKLQTDPPPGIIAEPKESDILTVFYALRGPPETVYQEGVYVGKLKFPPEYPMKPPSVYMLTPSGRFQCNTKICMSMSDFHPESWNPMWSVGTILTGIQSFMSSEELTTGGMKAPDSARRTYAQQSMAYNQKHFPDLFGGDILAALELADEAHRVAVEQNKQKATMDSSTSSRGRARNRTTRARATTSSSQADGTNDEEEQESNEAAAEATKELSLEEIEKRRQKNAKKRAKQKAKKAAAAADDEGQAEALGKLSLDENMN